jgi:hypothetical protein
MVVEEAFRTSGQDPKSHMERTPLNFISLAVKKPNLKGGVTYKLVTKSLKFRFKRRFNWKFMIA